MISAHAFHFLRLLAAAAALPGVNVAYADEQPVAPLTNYVIVCTSALEPAAREWAEYRTSPAGGGWRTVIHAVPPSMNALAQREDIRNIIRSAFRASAGRDPADFAVLLLGDTDSATNSDIPTWHFAQLDSVMRSRDGSNDRFASDHPYQIMDDADDSPAFALGRVPARTVEEARHVLAKIKRYEQPATIESLTGAGRARIAYTAGEGRFGVMDDLLETLFKNMVDRLVPDAFDLSMIYAKASSIYCPPPSKLTESVWNQLNDGALLFNYIGHGFAQGFDSLHWNNQRLPILNAGDVARLTNPPQPSAGGLLPIAFLSCCSSGWFDLPEGQRSMAEELLFAPRGSIAVIAGSRITHPYANTVMQMNITRSLLVDRTPTVGLLDLAATQGMLKRGPIDRQLDAIASPIARGGKWETSLADLRQMHVKLYNLIGDPATRIALPAHAIQNLAVKDGAISGAIPHMRSGRVAITAETIRTSMANPGMLQLPSGDADAELESKAANNFALVNDRVLARYEGEIIEGRFQIEINGSLPPNAAVIRAYAVGVNEAQRVFDAAGAIRVAAK